MRVNILEHHCAHVMRVLTFRRTCLLILIRSESRSIQEIKISFIYSLLRAAVVRLVDCSASFNTRSRPARVMRQTVRWNPHWYTTSYRRLSGTSTFPRILMYTRTKCPNSTVHSSRRLSSKQCATCVRPTQLHLDPTEPNRRSLVRYDKMPLKKIALEILRHATVMTILGRPAATVHL